MRSAQTTRWRDAVRDVRPMLASLDPAPLTDAQLVYEPKYDGIRALVDIDPDRAGGAVTIWSRLGNDKTRQFPELVQALDSFARRRRSPLLLDGEIVALDAHGEPAGFQKLQGRIHMGRGRPARPVPPQANLAPVAFIAFDLLRDGDDDLRTCSLEVRRTRLERVFGNTRSSALRLSDQVRGDGRPLQARAEAAGWEGLIAKRADSLYRSGKRTTDWHKLKILRQQEFIVGGWTEPRASRSSFGALLVGYYDAEGHLVYAGHVGTGFTETELHKLSRAMAPLEVTKSPFSVPPAGNEAVHWVKPMLVVEARFTEWTDDDRLRHPVYLGVRDDKKARGVVREDGRARAASAEGGSESQHDRRAAASATRKPRSTRRPLVTRTPRSARVPAPVAAKPPRDAKALATLVAELQQIEDGSGDGRVTLPDGDTLDVGHLKKVFWPEGRITKGDLLRYYVQVAPFILPVVADRPLVMKRQPDGITSHFYQQRAPDQVPPGVRIELVPEDAAGPVPDAPGKPGARGGKTDARETRGRSGSAAHVPEDRASDGTMRRMVGGSLKTLLYMAQLAAISQDPWFSRMGSLDTPDHVAIDLDPMDGVSFATVLDVARWVRDELAALKVVGFPKTSGSSGLHIFIPLPEATPYETGLIFCQIVATMVAEKHPRQATVERAVKARGRTVYVDYLQNIRGKTLACAYSARASTFAGASTPLTWQEVDGGVAPEDFTIRTLPGRLASVGDLWAALRKARGADLGRVARLAGR